jgi:NAD(P)-dependent dehydrogenase (short-subunit alcohol dehydrogenase family)
MTGPDRGTAALMANASHLAETPFTELFDFTGAACVVTGGAKGIGRAIATRFAELGADVILLDVDPSVAAVAAVLGTAAPGHVEARIVDVRDGAALDAVATSATAGPPRYVVWVNAAGIYPTNRLDDMTDTAWKRVIDLDLTGTFAGCRAAGLAMRTAGLPGVIVNISSVAGSRAGSPPGIAHYVAAKHGVEGLTKALAVELGPAGIRVVCIAPGTVVTEGLVDKFGPAGGDDDPYLRLARRMPIPRPSLPDDVARAAVFLASPAAAMITGSTLPVDAGHLAL